MSKTKRNAKKETRVWCIKISEAEHKQYVFPHEVAHYDSMQRLQQQHSNVTVVATDPRFLAQRGYWCDNCNHHLSDEWWLELSDSHLFAAYCEECAAERRTLIAKDFEMDPTAIRNADERFRSLLTTKLAA